MFTKKLSYRWQIARQLRTQSNNSTEMTFKGHSRSSERKCRGSIERISYYPTIVTRAIMLYRFPHPDIGRKSRNLYTPLVFNSAVGVPPSEFHKRYLVMRKLEWLGYDLLKIVWWYVKPFGYNTGAWRTDGSTDGQNSHINIARQMKYTSRQFLPGDACG